MEPRTIPIRNGRLTCRVLGSQADIRLEIRPDRPGLYRGVLTGPTGHWDLGLLLPEGDRLALGRTLPVDAMKRAGCWPIQGGRTVLAHAFDRGPEQRPPTGWQWTAEASDRFPNDPALAHAAGETVRWLLRQEAGGGFSLAAPWEPCCPFPLAPAFCLASVREMAGRRWVVYRFRAGGTPVLPDGEK